MDNGGRSSGGKETKQRFWGKVNKTADCWLWTASRRNKGYGAFVYQNQKGEVIQDRAHRFSWEVTFGAIPKGICVLHKCDNPSCVNPKHLFLGTRIDNNLDMCAKGRHRCGSSKTPVEQCKYKRGVEHHAFRIKKETISQLKQDRTYGLSYGNLAEKYNISIGYIWRICNGFSRKYE